MYFSRQPEQTSRNTFIGIDSQRSTWLWAEEEQGKDQELNLRPLFHSAETMSQHDSQLLLHIISKKPHGVLSLRVPDYPSIQITENLSLSVILFKKVSTSLPAHNRIISMWYCDVNMGFNFQPFLQRSFDISISLSHKWMYSSYHIYYNITYLELQPGGWY